MGDAVILLVNDDEAGRSDLARLLCLDGYAVWEAARGSQALEALTQVQPDLVILDLHLPGLSNSEVVRHLRAQPDTPSLPILCLAAPAGEASIAVCLAEGADAFLAKPPLPEVLRAQVKTLLRARRLHQEADRAREQAEQQAAQLTAAMDDDPERPVQERPAALEGTHEALREAEARRQVAEAVAEERQRLFDVLETLPAMICLLTPDYHIAFANRIFRAHFGDSNGRLCYERCFGLSEPCAFCQTYRVLETGEPHRWEVEIPGGRTFEAHDFPFADVDGSPLILEIDIDVTAHRHARAELIRHREHLEELVAARTAQLEAEAAERKQAEVALRESEGRYRGLFDAMQEGMALLEVIGDPARDDFDLRYVEVNPHYEAVTGLARKDLTGRPLREVLPTAPPGWFTAVAREALATGATFSGPHLSVSGRWVQAHAYCPREGQVAVLLADITAATQAEEALLAAERARAELAERLAGEIDHRVKNNLAMISGLLQMQLLGEHDEAAVDALREAASRIRAFAAIHEQVYASREEQADLLVALKQLAVAITELFAGRGDTGVTVQGEPFRCHARAATNLSAVANELITNALKHGGPGPDGRHTVTVMLRRTDEGVTLSVSNSGPPVSDELDPAHSPTMGLRLVHDLVVVQYGGRFMLSPSEGGTLAEVVVPAKAIEADSSPR